MSIPVNLKLLLSTIIVLSLFNNLTAQETKLIVKKGSGVSSRGLKPGYVVDLNPGVKDNNYIEEYDVMVADETVRHGKYLKYRQTFSGIQILETGTYKNGQQDGRWEYFHDSWIRSAINGLREAGTYVNGRKNGVWTSYYPDSVSEAVNVEPIKAKRKTTAVNVEIGQRAPQIQRVGMYLNDKRIKEWYYFTKRGQLHQRFDFSKQKLLFDSSIKDTANFNVSRPSLFLGGLQALYDEIGTQLSLPVEIMQSMKKDSVFVVISFTIDTKGNATDISVEGEDYNKHLADDALRTVSAISDHWIPAVNNSESVESRKRILFYAVKNFNRDVALRLIYSFRVLPDKADSMF